MTISTFFIDGPAGRLEALLNAGDSNAKYSVLLCHPHPMFGGTMHNKVVFHAMKALNSFGFPVLRFNFRGAGLSHGQHDQGRGELEDVRVALDWLSDKFVRPVILAGFSFGAAVGLQVACHDERVRALIGLGVPVAAVESRSYDLSCLAHCAKPKLFLSGGYDQYGSKAQLRDLVQSLPEPKKLVIINDADHFFEGKLQEMRAAIEDWVSSALNQHLL